MNKLTLVVLAAGMGSRYGRLKQLDVFTVEGDSIVDFSIYDAIRAGFEKIVFVIRKCFADEFKAFFNGKLHGAVEIVYVYQELDSVPKTFIHPDRIKPWGTGHALLMAKDVISGNFAVINADDFYGREAFQIMAQKLSENKQSNHFYMMAYLLKRTVSQYGAVSRGECEVNNQGFLVAITERTQIETVNGHLMRRDDSKALIPIADDTIVSMNFWGFTPAIFDYILPLFQDFLKKNKQNLKSEFYLPAIVNHILATHSGKVEVLRSYAQWFGVTYQDDQQRVKTAIQQLKASNVYPKYLWET